MIPWHKLRDRIRSSQSSPPEPPFFIEEPTDDEIRAAQVVHWFLDKPEDFKRTCLFKYENKKQKIKIFFDIKRVYNTSTFAWETEKYRCWVSFGEHIIQYLEGDLAEAGYNQCKALDKKRHKEYMDKNWPLPIYPKPTKRKSK